MKRAFPRYPTRRSTSTSRPEGPLSGRARPRVSSNISQLKNKLVTVPAWHLPLFVMVNIVSPFFHEKRRAFMCTLRALMERLNFGLRPRRHWPTIKAFLLRNFDKRKQL